MCNMCNSGFYANRANGNGCGGYAYNGYNGGQTICRDCCGNIRVNYCGRPCQCGCCGNGNSNGAQGNVDNGNANGNYGCLLVCGYGLSQTQASPAATGARTCGGCYRRGCFWQN